MIGSGIPQSPGVKWGENRYCGARIKDTVWGKTKAGHDGIT